MSHNYSISNDKFALGISHKQQLQILANCIRGALQAQCFWRYPPPMIDDGFGGLELYKRYKYGREERKHFSNCDRRYAAKLMVKFYLLQKEVKNVYHTGTIS